MRIVFLMPGGGFPPLGARTRGLTLARGLAARGHDALAVPLYAPFDPGDLEEGSPEALPQTTPPPLATPYRPASSGLGLASPADIPGHMRVEPVHMEFNSPAWRRVWPGWRLPGPDGKKRNASAEARRAICCLSDGYRRPAVLADRLAAWLASLLPRPDAVITLDPLSFRALSLLRGRCPDIPLMAFTGDGETGLRRYRPPERTTIRRLLRAHAGSIDRVLAPGALAAQCASELLGLPAGRLRLVRPTLGYRTPPPVEQRLRNPFTIGYLSAISPDGGLDRLARAFHQLVSGLERDARLWIAGPVLDYSYWKSIRQWFHRAGLLDWVTFFGALDAEGERKFYRRLSVFAVPSNHPEAWGGVFLEAMAAGVPVAAPGVGVVADIMRGAAGGVLLPPDAISLWAETFALLMDEPATADNLGRRGRARVLRHHAPDAAVDDLISVLREFPGTGL